MKNIFETYRDSVRYGVDEEKGVLFIEKGASVVKIPLTDITDIKIWGTWTCVGLDIDTSYGSYSITAADSEDGVSDQNRKGSEEMDRFWNMYANRLGKGGKK